MWLVTKPSMSFQMRQHLIEPSGEWVSGGGGGGGGGEGKFENHTGTGTGINTDPGVTKIEQLPWCDEN